MPDSGVVIQHSASIFCAPMAAKGSKRIILVQGRIRRSKRKGRGRDSIGGCLESKCSLSVCPLLAKHGIIQQTTWVDIGREIVLQIENRLTA